jgi:hypothetical protein
MRVLGGLVTALRFGLRVSAPKPRRGPLRSWHGCRRRRRIGRWSKVHRQFQDGGKVYKAKPRAAQWSAEFLEGKLSHQRFPFPEPRGELTDAGMLKVGLDKTAGDIRVGNGSPETERP